jgi:hypothetical protein
MPPENSPHHARHHVRLPSGKQIEVIYLDSHEPPALDTRHGETARAAEPLHVSEPLHVCFYCAGELVYPLDWAEAGPSQWRILLRCPECEATREGVFDQTTVECLDDELDRATGALVSDLQRVTHANMAEEIELFVRALDADLIVPSDF